MVWKQRNHGGRVNHERRRKDMFSRALASELPRFWIGAFLSNVGTGCRPWPRDGSSQLMILRSGGDSTVSWNCSGFFLTLAGGVFADLVDRRRCCSSHSRRGGAAFALAILVVTHHVTFTWCSAFPSHGCAWRSLSVLSGVTYDLLGRESRQCVALIIAVSTLACGRSVLARWLQVFGLAGCFMPTAFRSSPW